MDISLGTASYDIRFAREKARQDIAAIEADWGAALERIRAKGGNIIGLGGGAGGNGATHNGAVAGGGQPVSQVSANGNGSRAAAAVNGAAGQNDLLAQAAKNPLMRAAYFSSNQATIAPSMAAQLGVTTQQLADAMTGNGGGASVAARGAPNGQDHVRAGGGGNTVIASGDKTGGSFATLRRGVMASGAVAAAAFVAGMMEAVEKGRQDIFNAGGDVLKRELVGRPGKQIQNFIGGIPLIGGTLAGATSLFTGSEDRRIMGNISTREAEASAVIRRRQTAQISNEASLAFMGGSPSYSALLSVGPETQLEIASLNEQRRRASLGAKTDSERGIINRSFGDQINAVSAFGDTREASARFGMFREGSFSRMNQRALGRLAQMRPALAHSSLVAEQGAFDLISGEAAIEGDLDKRMRAEQAKATPDVDRIRQMHSDARAAKENLFGRARERVGELTVGRLDVLKNIYGGRPEEIGGFQSVEARRDISPETNQMAFEAYTKAIEALTDEIRRLNGGKN